MSKVFTAIVIALAVAGAFHLLGPALSHSFNPINSALSQVQQ